VTLSARKYLRFPLIALMFAAVFAGCGGGAQKAPPPAPVVQVFAVATPPLPTAFFGEFYTATLQTGGGVGRVTWEIVNGALPAGLNLDHDNGIISGIVTDAHASVNQLSVRAADSAGHSATSNLTMTVETRPLRFLTTSLRDTVVHQPYIVGLLLSQPAGRIHLSAGSGPLPPGLVLETGMADGVIRGESTTTGTFQFTLEAQNATTTAQQTFQMKVKPSGTSNDQVADAASLSTGVYPASISPYGEPASQAHPDQDYYKLTAQPGSVVSLQITAEQLGPMDSVIELVDASGARLITCDEPGTSGFTHPCMNDDNLEEFTLDSKLLFKAPAGTPTTLFLHVLDWRGDARPDMQYQIEIFGAD
jgi:hypothetical protein